MSEERESLYPIDLAQGQDEASERVMDLVGRTLERIEVMPSGVLFYFSSKNGDEGVLYWAYGGPWERLRRGDAILVQGRST